MAIIILPQVLVRILQWQKQAFKFLEVLSFCNQARAQHPSIMITVLTFSMEKKSTMKLSRVSVFLRIHEKKLRLTSIHSNYLNITSQWKIFPKWVAFKPIICQDSSQIWMVSEKYTKHVPDLQERKGTQYNSEFLDYYSEI